MKCLRCSTDVPPDAKFCPECGASLALACRACGAANAAGHKFCRQCGETLAAATRARRDDGQAASPENYTPKHLAAKILSARQSVVGERKQISVLFADIKGSMEMLDDRDPEEARAILDPVLKLMMEAVHRYEGTVNQVMGDGIMALFGAPLAHEDHAVRACYAALRIQEAVVQCARTVKRSHGVDVRVRVGLNSGEVVVRSVGSDLRMDYTAVGQTTHLAARMEQMALPGTILITADGLRAAEGFVQATPLGPRPVKGMSAPVDVYEVTGAGQIRTRLQAAVARGLTRFTGREPALTQLHGAIALARNGKGQVVSIVGEPGVGKSRLLHEFIRCGATRDWLVLETGAISYGRATSFLPVVQLLRGYFRLDERDDDAQVRRKIGAALAALDQALAPALLPLLALFDVPVTDAVWLEANPAQRRKLTFDALKQLLLRQAQAQPLLMVFEDLHAFDAESEALLNRLVDNLAGRPALVLATYRPEYQPQWGHQGYCSSIRIEPLTGDGTHALLTALLGDQPALEPVIAMLVERTGGNPFFLEEGVRALIETAVIAGKPGAYRLLQDLKTAQVQVPATVQAVLASRIDRLSPEEKWLLQSAAVIGREVPFALLQAILDEDEDALRGLLERLQAAEFLYETRLFPELEYSFKHALTQEVAYNALLHETRRSLHGRIVQALERMDSRPAPDHVDQLAHHAVRGELWAKAITYLRQAGLRATERNATGEAVECVEQALAALGHLGENEDTMGQAVDLRFDLHSALIPLGEFSRIVEVLREAEQLADRLGDQRRQGRVSAAMATWCWCIGDPDRALAYGRRALAMASTLADGALDALANHRVGEAHVSHGNFHQAIDSFARNLERPTIEPKPQRYGMAALQSVTSRAWMGWCMAGLGDFAAATEAAQESLRIAEAANHAYSLATTYAGAGQRHLMRGEVEEAIMLLERAADICRRGNFGPLYKYAAPSLGLAYVRSGRVDEGLELLERLTAQSSSMNIVPFHVLELINLSEARLAAGRHTEAMESAQRSLALLRAHGQRFAEPECLRVLGDIHASSEPPRLADAEACYRSAITLAAELGLRPVIARCHLHLGSLYGANGQRAEALEHLVQARNMLREMDMRFWLQQAESAILRWGGQAAAGPLFDPSRPEFRADPYPFYHRLRSEDPVHQTALGYWIVTRYHDVVTVLRDQRFGREDFGPMVASVYGEDSQRVPRPMVFRDPPAHTRLRALVGRAFTGRLVQAMRPRVQEIVDQLLDRVQDARAMDVIADLAYPLPVTVICEMLGVPATDIDRLRQWTSDITRSLDALGLESDRGIVRRGRAARHALGEYFRSLLPARRSDPRQDLLSRLISAEDDGGDRLTEDELLATCVLLFIAGHETTVNLIGNGLLALLRHPGQADILRNDPALIPAAVEELLRYDSPVQRTARVTRVDVEIGGKTIPRHSLVVAAIGAANRDPGQFADPDRLDVRRRDCNHVAFGYGIHFCLGAPLARIEAEIAITTFLRRMPRAELTATPAQWRDSSTLRGLSALPVVY